MKLHGLVKGKLRDLNFRKYAGERQEMRIQLQNRPNRGCREESQTRPFSQQDDAKGVIELGVGKQDRFDWNVPQGRGRIRWNATELFSNVRRRIEKKPAVAVAANCDRG